MNEKEQWIIDYLKNKHNLKFVDVLDYDFVIKYIETFEAKFEDMTLGAPKCKELSKLLSSMHNKGVLNRSPLGVRKGLCKDGRFPKWIYIYELK